MYTEMTTTGYLKKVQKKVQNQIWTLLSSQYMTRTLGKSAYPDFFFLFLN